MRSRALVKPNKNIYDFDGGRDNERLKWENIFQNLNRRPPWLPHQLEGPRDNHHCTLA